MVFGRLIRSIGLVKAQATKEEYASDTDSINDAVSVPSSCGRIQDKLDQEEFDQTTDTGDESSDSDSSGLSSGNFVQTIEVYPKALLLDFRAAVTEQGEDEVARTLTVEAVEQHGSKAKCDLDRSDAMTPTAGSWVAAMQFKRSTSDPDLDDEEVTRKTRSILNKLTFENFDALFEQLASCGIRKPAHVEMLMREVFDKATTQHHFIGMYADLCMRIEQDSRISSVVDAAGEQHSFRWFLVNQCQISFEKLLQPTAMQQGSNVGKMVDEEFALKRKQQALGNIRLIGQLVVHRMVTSNVLIECCEELLRRRDSCPEALEFLAALVTVAGKQFDTKAWQHHSRFVEVFSCMRKLSKDKSTQPRNRFLLRDVLDVREADWTHCTQKAALTTAPMKLEDVRESADAVAQPATSEMLRQQSFQTTLAPEHSMSTAKTNDKLTPVLRKRSMSGGDIDDDVARKLCSILNKLTVENFDALFEQLATCGIRTPEHLDMLMREIYNKATTQHHFLAMYADLCVRIEADHRISSLVDGTGQQHSFRWLLVNHCQTSFDVFLNSASMPQLSKDMEMDEEVDLKRKQQALGNIKLIGQLVVRRLVTSNVLVVLSEELLRHRNSRPEALESLAALITVTGKQFDTKTWQYHPRLLEVFSCMQKLSKDKLLKPRIRFLLRDVLDIRDAGWSHCTYTATITMAPMKLDEVRESAANEGKYKSLEDQVETDNMLTNLLSIAQMANTKRSSVSPESTPMHSKVGRQGNSRQHRGINKDMPVLDKEEAKGSSPLGTPAFDLVSFRRTLTAILADLASDRKVSVAVRRLLSQEVPKKLQAKEFADILTRIVEEKRGPIRRCELTFAAGLAGSEEHSGFDRGACLNGIGLFFHEVYSALCEEIPRLPAIVTRELLPTLRNIFSEAELTRRLPADLSATEAFQQALASRR